MRTAYPNVRPRVIVPLLLAIVTLPASAGPSRAEMTRATAISAGSFFAAAAMCERHGEIATGQVAPMLRDIDKHLSRNNRRWIAEGYQRGFEKAAVYIPENKQWIPLTTDKAECDRVQGVLDDYKAILMPPPGNKPPKN